MQRPELDSMPLTAPDLSPSYRKNHKQSPTERGQSETNNSRCPHAETKKLQFPRPKIVNQLSPDTPNNLSQFQICNYEVLESPSSLLTSHYKSPCPVLFEVSPALLLSFQTDGEAHHCIKESLFLHQIWFLGGLLGFWTLGTTIYTYIYTL